MKINEQQIRTLQDKINRTDSSSFSSSRAHHAKEITIKLNHSRNSRLKESISMPTVPSMPPPATPSYMEGSNMACMQVISKIASHYKDKVEFGQPKKEERDVQRPVKRRKLAYIEANQRVQEGIKQLHRQMCRLYKVL